MSFPDIETSLRSGLGKPMTDIVLKLSAVLERLPVAIGLVSSTGHFVGKAGGMAGILDRMDPSHDVREATRWSFKDRRGAAIPRSEWPSARALRGERHCDLQHRSIDELARALARGWSAPETANVRRRA